MASFALANLSVGALRGKLSRATWAGLLSASVWQIANYIIPLATFPYLARVLGVSGFGIIGVGMAITSYALLLTDWGFALSGTQQIARERDNPAAMNRIIWQTIAAKSILGLISAGAMALCAFLFVDSAELRAVLLMSLLNIVGSVFTVDWALRGVEALSQFATASIIGRLASVPLVFLLVHESSDVVEATFAAAAGGLVMAALTLGMARRLGILGRPSLSPRDVLLCLKDGAHIFLSSALINIYTSSLTVILGFVAGTQAAGVFTAAEKIRRPAHSLLSPISMVFYPRMSFLAGNDPERAREASLHLFRVQGGIAFLLSSSLCVCASPAVKTLLGPGFDEAIIVLSILSWLIFLIGLSNVLALMVMWPFGMKREVNICLLAGAAVGLGLAVALSYCSGAVGAAIAAVLSEATVSASMFWIVSRHFTWFRPFKL